MIIVKAGPNALFTHEAGLLSRNVKQSSRTGNPTFYYVYIYIYMSISLSLSLSAAVTYCKLLNSNPGRGLLVLVRSFGGRATLPRPRRTLKFRVCVFGGLQNPKPKPRTLNLQPYTLNPQPICRSGLAWETTRRVLRHVCFTEQYHNMIATVFPGAPRKSFKVGAICRL